MDERLPPVGEEVLLFDPLSKCSQKGELSGTFTWHLENQLSTFSLKWFSHWHALPKPPHASDCAVHNEPAYPNGECDCGIKKP